MGVEGPAGTRGSHPFPHPNPGPLLRPQEPNSELQAKYQKLLVRCPGEQDERGWDARLWGQKRVQ